jgi:formylglycine-generating enzyme required for sulfatase activity
MTVARMQRRAADLVSLAVVAAIASSCQVIGGYKSFEPGDGAPPHPCDVLPATKLDDKGIATLVLSKETNGQCYWIDQTEVTRQQYDSFLADHTPPAWSALSAQCTWKTAKSDPVGQTADSCTMSTTGEQDPFRMTKPIRCVDWCDAKAFCSWAGKDLCGGITNTGAAVVPADRPDQWGDACSAGGLSYPYGATPQSAACNVGLTDAQCLELFDQIHCAPTDVGSPTFAQCTAPSGAVDMIGNVSEWVITCGAGDAGAATLCQHRGGSFAGSLEGETCYMLHNDTLATRDRTIGLRCCVELTTQEAQEVSRGTR